MHLPSNLSSRGMTLIELLVVIAIVTSAGIALSGAIQYFYKSNAYLLEQTTALDSARRGVREAVGAIRESSYGDDGAYPIETAATSSLTFYSDYDKDASVEKEVYKLQGTTLYRVVTNSGGSPPTYTGQALSTTTIATYVMNGTTPVFTYYDVNGAQLTAANVDEADIASVTITLMVDINPTRAPNIFTLTEAATLRNLRATE